MNEKLTVKSKTLGVAVLAQSRLNSFTATLMTGSQRESVFVVCRIFHSSAQGVYKNHGRVPVSDGSKSAS